MHLGMLAYEPRAIAFLDILGMQNLVARIENDLELWFNLDDALRRIKDYERHSSIPESILSKMEVSVFSDSIAISTEPENLHHLVAVCSDLQGLMLLFNLPIRGGIAIAKTVHGDGILYGDGIIQAYYLESKHAKNPRILLENGLEEKLPVGFSAEYLDADNDSRMIVAPYFITPYIDGAEELAADGYDPRQFFLANTKSHLEKNQGRTGREYQGEVSLARVKIQQGHNNTAQQAPRFRNTTLPIARPSLPAAPRIPLLHLLFQSQHFPRLPLRFRHKPILLPKQRQLPVPQSRRVPHWMPRVYLANRPSRFSVIFVGRNTSLAMISRKEPFGPPSSA